MKSNNKSDPMAQSKTARKGNVETCNRVRGRRMRLVRGPWSVVRGPQKKAGAIATDYGPRTTDESGRILVQRQARRRLRAGRDARRQQGDGRGQALDGLLERRGVRQQAEVLIERLLQADQLRLAGVHVGDHLDRQVDRIGQPGEARLMIAAMLVHGGGYLGEAVEQALMAFQQLLLGIDDALPEARQGPVERLHQLVMLRRLLLPAYLRLLHACLPQAD